jgi:hypothetical protein
MERVVTLARNTLRYQTPAVAALHRFLKEELASAEGRKKR